MPDCDAYKRGTGSALPHYSNSYASFPRICVIFLRPSRRLSRNAQEDMMSVSIVHGKLVAEDLSYSIIKNTSATESGSSYSIPPDGQAGVDLVIV